MRKILTTLLVLIFIGTGARVQSEDVFKREKYVRNNETLQYRIMYPKNFSKEKVYPLLLFLHGAGERGNDNQAQLSNGSQLFLKKENRDKYPAIIVFPQSPKDDSWVNVTVDRTGSKSKFDFKESGDPTISMKLVMGLMDKITSQKYVDINRIYVGGLSMGGMGTFEILSRKPAMFAAAFAICGGAHPQIAKNYREGIDLWIFHGEKDDVVPAKYSKRMVNAINKAGGNAKFTLYENTNHNSWDLAFAEPDLMPWVFSKAKSIHNYSLLKDSGKEP